MASLASHTLPGAAPAGGAGPLDAVLFDMDGVITNTAGVHAAVWKRVFDQVLHGYPGQAPFDLERDYHAYVDGRLRFDGVATFLASRGITLPRGAEDDSPDAPTICGLGNRKNGYFRDWLHHHTVATYPAALRLIARLREAGIKTAVFSASRNASAVLDKAGVLDLFDAKVDGTDLHRLGLPGKPDPAILREATARLGVQPARAAVVEDAVAGVEAGARGGFGLVVGVDRGSNAAALKQAGAGLVVRGLAEVEFTPAVGLAAKTLSGLPLMHDRQDDIRARVAGRALAVFLDYDGTLTPIVEDYTRAFLSRRMRAAVAELARHCTVAVVSGRDASVVRDLVQLEMIYYAGSHGFEIHGPGGRKDGLEKGVEFLPVLDRTEAWLREGLAGIEGHAVERKRFEISVHYRRMAEADVPRTEAVIDGALARASGLHKGRGKKVFRIQPDIEWDKGRAVLWMLDRFGKGRHDVLPVYVGDDITDEDAFRALSGRGLTFVVRDVDDRVTAADYGLADTDDVERLLRVLAAIAGDGQASAGAHA